MTLTLSAILLMVAFVIPGYLANCSRRRFVIRRILTGTDLVLESLIASTFVYLFSYLVSWPFGWNVTIGTYIIDLASSNPLDATSYNEIGTLIICYAFILLLSYMGGGLYGHLQKTTPGRTRYDRAVNNARNTESKNYYHKALIKVDDFIKWFGFHTNNQYASEWDRLFEKSPVWVFVRMKNGSAYRGVYLGVSSHPDPHEILLGQAVYWHPKIENMDESNAEPLENYDRVWITGEEITAIYATLPIEANAPPPFVDYSIKS